MRRRLFAAAASTLLATTLLAAPAQAAGHSGPPPVDWADCGDGFQCATVPAPLDYDKPRGAQIGIAVIRLPASDPARRIGSLLLNPGGPGGSGVDFAQGIAAAFPAEVRARFDIVGFDPRGVSRSTPLRCFDSLDEAFETLPAAAYPETPAEERLQKEADDKLARACAKHGGAIRDHMSTADVARDMDLLRRAFGDRKLNYLGYSYGSLLGQYYANMFPGNFRALVIDAVVDPTQWTGKGTGGNTVPIGSRIRSADGAQKTLEEFFRTCDAAGDACALSGGAEERFDSLADRLRGNPAQIIDPFSGETVPFTYNDLILITLITLYDPFSWQPMAEYIAAIEAQVDPATLGRQLSALRTRLGVGDAAQEEYENLIEASPGVTCSDTQNPRSFAAWQKAADEAERRDGYFGRLWNWNWGVCRSWPASAGQDGYYGPWTKRTASPVLIVGNHYDPATRYEGAVAASKLLPNSRLLSYAGWGHGAYLFTGNACVDQHVTDYLVSGTLPAKGTLCQPVGTPFVPGAAPAADAAELTAAAAPAAAWTAFGNE